MMKGQHSKRQVWIRSFGCCVHPKICNCEPILDNSISYFGFIVELMWFSSGEEKFSAFVKVNLFFRNFATAKLMSLFGIYLMKKLFSLYYKMIDPEDRFLTGT